MASIYYATPYSLDPDGRVIDSEGHTLFLVDEDGWVFSPVGTRLAQVDAEGFMHLYDRRTKTSVPVPILDLALLLELIQHGLQDHPHANVGAIEG